MRKLLSLLTLCIVALTAQAKGWDDQQYKQIEQSIRMPQFADKVYDITKYGAKTTNTAAKNQKAIQKAIDKCSKKGGGRVVIPAGQKFLTAAIQLKSGVNLEVQEGAVLEFAFEPEALPHRSHSLGRTGLLEPLTADLCLSGPRHCHHG